MWELFWAGTEVSTLEKTTLVAKLASGRSARDKNMHTGQRETYDFARSEVGTPPGRGVSGSAVVTLSPDAVCELGRGIVGVANQIIGRGLVVLGLVRGSEILHWAGRDRVGSRGVRVGGRVRLGVSRAIVVWRGRLVVEAVCLRGGVSCLHYDLIRVGRGRVKVPGLLRRELERRGEQESEGTRLKGTCMGGGGRPGGTIRRQRRGRLLELDLGGRELDAFVRSVLPGGGLERENGERRERKDLWKESERCLEGSRETETFMLMRCCCW